MFQWFVNKFGHGNPWSAFLHFLFLIHFIVFTISGLTSAYWGLAMGNYLRKNHFELWKKCWSFWIPTRIKAQKLVGTTDDLVLRNLRLKQERYGKICLLTFVSAVALMFIIIISEVLDFTKT